jgi:argininosuccinate lyase
VCIERGISLEEVDLAAYKTFSPLIEEDIYAFISVENCVARRKVPGGPAPEMTEAAIGQARTWLRRMQDDSAEKVRT